ncbi:MAG: DUF4382 domain-containing protein [Crocinitomicaceae bacterium]|jgi:major membrane immunogen (membrane-anchored lipoprotein)|nr:DUF4382 domain-containing protein [Crocinitomicaceae bacterium]
MKITKMTMAVIAIIGLFFTACKKENVANNNPSSSTKAGSFKVRMTDAPGDYEGLYVEIDKGEAYLEGSGWVLLNNQAQMVSVMDLTNGAETNIAYLSSVKACTYSKLRLTFGDENSIKLNSSTELGLKLPAGISTTASLDLNAETMLGQERTVEIVIDETVSAETGANVLLDFNVAQSVIENETGWMLDPIITSIEDELTGLRGEIQGAQQASITVQTPQGEISTNTDANGFFMIRGLAAGTYNLVIDAEVEGKHVNEIRAISGVTVSEGRIENIGTVQF